MPAAFLAAGTVLSVFLGCLMLSEWGGYFRHFDKALQPGENDAHAFRLFVLMVCHLSGRG